MGKKSFKPEHISSKLFSAPPVASVSITYKITGLDFKIGAISILV
jgi:hypothetical protein